MQRKGNNYAIKYNGNILSGQLHLGEYSIAKYSIVLAVYYRSYSI